MANPQPDKYVRLSTELLEAIYQRAWSVRQLRVALWVIRKSYGWNRKWAPAMSARQIGKEVGMDFSNAARAVAGLVRAGVLKRDGDRFYLIKDYEKWAVDGVDNPVDKKRGQIDHTPKRGQIDHGSVAKSTTVINKEVKDIKTKDTAQTTRGPEINLLITEFQICLRNKIHEVPASFNRGAAARGFKRLLAAYPRHDIQPRFNAWFASTDQHIATRTWRVEDFFAYFNRLKDGPILAKGEERRPDKVEDDKHCRRCAGTGAVVGRDSEDREITLACICPSAKKGIRRWNGASYQEIDGILVKIR